MSLLLVLEVLFANAATRACAIAAGFWLAARPLARYSEALLAAAAGFLAAMALTHLIPEAFESESADPHDLGLVMLAVILVFIAAGRLLSSLHVHRGCRAGGGAHSDEGLASGLPALFCAASLHSFVDGLLIAATFLASASAGWLAALAVLIHEMPQQVGFFVILKSAGKSRLSGALFCAGASSFSLVGAALGLIAVGVVDGLLPYAIAMSAASFLYITFFSLLPEVFCNSDDLRTSIGKIALILAGAALSLLLLGFTHQDDHHHEQLERNASTQTSISEAVNSRLSFSAACLHRPAAATIQASGPRAALQHACAAGVVVPSGRAFEWKS